MSGLDCNILVQLAFPQHPAHAATAQLIDAELVSGTRFVLASFTATEFLHVATDTRRFTSALAMDEAIDWLEYFIRDNNVRLVEPSTADFEQMLLWIKRYRLGRKRILDTQLAAALKGANIVRLITSNPADFKIFGVFELVTP